MINKWKTCLLKQDGWALRVCHLWWRPAQSPPEQLHSLHCGKRKVYLSHAMQHWSVIFQLVSKLEAMSMCLHCANTTVLVGRTPVRPSVLHLLCTSADLPGRCFAICNIAQCREMENMMESVNWIYIEMQAHEGNQHGQHLVREHRTLIRLLLSDSPLRIVCGIQPWFFFFFPFFKCNVMLLKAI